MAHTKLDEQTILRGIGAILRTICLVHDIGNPPFGHFGEEVIQDYFKQLFKKLENNDCDVRIGLTQNNYLTKDERKGFPRSSNINDNRTAFQLNHLDEFLKDENCKYDYTQFDGNAQGLRVLTKLQYLGDLYGLNLTYATLGASIKYPNLQGKKPDGPVGLHKHGVMTTERNEMKMIANKCGLNGENGTFLRHPLAFLMEAADSICYIMMDLDDARQHKWVDTNDIWDVVNSCKEEVKSSIYERYNQIMDDGNNESKKWMCLRTAIFSYLMQVALTNFVEKLSEIESGEYADELIDGDELAKKLLSLSKKKILSQRKINSLETTGKAVISGLLDHYISLMFHPKICFRNRAKVLMSRSVLQTVIAEHIRDYGEQFRDKYIGANSVEDVFDDFDIGDLTAEERFRAIRDYVAGMTDKFALNHYKELSGQRLS